MRSQQHAPAPHNSTRDADPLQAGETLFVAGDAGCGQEMRSTGAIGSSCYRATINLIPSPSLIIPLEHLIKPGAHISACGCIEQFQSRRSNALSNLSNHLRAVAAAARFGRGGGKGTRSREATTLCVGGSVDPVVDPRRPPLEWAERAEQ